MTAHGRVRLACEIEDSVDFKRDLAAILVVEDVVYRPHKWSLEVEKVGEFPIGGLPQDMHPKTRQWIGMVGKHI
jgi:hypothetical protein